MQKKQHCHFQKLLFQRMHLLVLENLQLFRVQNRYILHVFHHLHLHFYAHRSVLLCLIFLLLSLSVYLIPLFHPSFLCRHIILVSQNRVQTRICLFHLHHHLHHLVIIAFLYNLCLFFCIDF